MLLEPAQPTWLCAAPFQTRRRLTNKHHNDSWQKESVRAPYPEPLELPCRFTLADEDCSQLALVEPQPEPERAPRMAQHAHTHAGAFPRRAVCVLTCCCE